MYRIRIPIGLALIGLVYLLGYIDYRTNTPYATSSIMGIALIVALWEFYVMSKNRGYQPYITYSLVSCFFMLLFSTFIKWPVDPFALVLVGVCIRFLWDTDKENALENAAVTIFGLVYVYFLLSYALKIRTLGSELQQNMNGLYYLIFLVFVAKSMDIGGYLIGKACGKHKIIPSISPNKSYEGAFGGIMMAIAVAFLFHRYIPLINQSLTTVHVIIFACLMSVLSLVGDFVESLIKRRCDVKDSNNLIPEFGGILDLVDSLLLVSPVGYYYLLCFISQ